MSQLDALCRDDLECRGTSDDLVAEWRTAYERWGTTPELVRSPPEDPEPVSVSDEGLRKDLDGNLAIEPRVACPIHFAHSAGAEGRENLVRTDALSIEQGHESGLIL